MNSTYTLSFFNNAFSQTPVTITLAQFIDSIRGTQYQAVVERYRLLLSQGLKAEASEVKRGLPAACIAAECQGGRSLKYVHRTTQLASLDMDYTGVYTDQVFALLSELSFVVACFRSVSGQGIKVVVNIGPLMPEEYRTAYTALSTHVSGLTGHACDKQCSDLVRLCYASHDPLAYFNPQAEIFPWRDGLGEGLPTPVPTTPPAEPLPPFLTGTALAFLEEFLQYNPFVTTTRHLNMLKLGRKAASKDFSEEELEALIREAIRRLAVADYNDTQMRQDITSGYQYVMRKIAAEEVSSLTMVPVESDDDSIDKVLLLEKNQEIQAALPYIPERVYQRMPCLLKKGAKLHKASRERDFLLMAMMANLSTCLPKVRFRYDNLDYSCHFFFAAVAGTASGKGVVAHAAQLSLPLHKYLHEKTAAVYRDYEVQMRRYEMDQQKAWKEGRELEREAPVKPPVVTLQVSGNCSKSMLVKILLDNGEMGAVINASEINTLVSSMGQDYGKMDDLFCAATHHEGYGRAFVKDGDTAWMEFVRLALCVSGTVKQFVDFVRSQENGFFSRIGALTAQSQPEFRSCRPREGSVDLPTHLHELGKEVLAIYQKLIDMPHTRIHFTDEQWDRHTAYFQKTLLRVRFEGTEDVNAVVFRFALLAMRLAAIFSVLRKWEDGIYAMDRWCTDEDFESAMDIIDVMLKHTLQLSTLFPPVNGKKLNQYERVLNAIRRLSAEFTYTEGVNALVHSGVSRGTAKRWIPRAVEFQFLEKQGDKYVKTGLV